MMQALRQNAAPKRYLFNTFFSTVRTFTTKTVEVDIQKSKRHIAGFTSPLAPANVVDREGFETFETGAGYIKERMPLRAADVLHRQMGENMYSPLNPEQRAAIQIGLDLRTLEERIVRREEVMCAEALFTGKVHIKGDGINRTVDFGYENDIHKKVLSSTSCWDKDGDPMRDLDEWISEIVTRCGRNPNRLIVGSDVVWAIIDNPKVQKRLDLRRFEMGLVKVENLPEGVRYLGTLTPPGIDIYTYDEVYTDPDDGLDKPIVPKDSILLGSTEAGSLMLYGVIENMKKLAAVSRFPFTWEEPDGRARWLQIESAPLPNLYQVDAYLTAKVLSV